MQILDLRTLLDLRTFLNGSESRASAPTLRSWVQCLLGQHFIAGFFCFHVVKSLMPILPFSPISANLWKTQVSILVLPLICSRDVLAQELNWGKSVANSGFSKGGGGHENLKGEGCQNTIWPIFPAKWRTFGPGWGARALCPPNLLLQEQNW